MIDIDYLRLFESLPHCDSMCNIVEDWGYAPNLYYFDQEWHVSWIDSAEGDCLCDFVGKSPEEAIINAHRSIIITDNSIKFYNILIPKDENNLINDIWNTEEELPEYHKLLLCLHKKGKFLAILQENHYLFTVPGSLIYHFEDIIKWAYADEIFPKI